MDNATTILAHAKSQMMKQPGWEERLTPTNVDRRECKRVRPMEVLALGLERTGTASLRCALFDLGYFDVYHMFSTMVENPKDSEMWAAAYDAKYFGKGTFTKEQWDQLLGHCMAVCDQPCAGFGQELQDAYPEAKVILTVRDTPQAWTKSVTETICALVNLTHPKFVREPGWNPLYNLARIFAPRLMISPFMDRIAEAHHVDEIPTKGDQMYLEHNAEIRRITPKENLLEFNVKEGWGPLCAFLGKPIPDHPFPNVNDTAEFKARVAKLKYLIPLGYTINFMKLVGLPAAVVGLAYLYKGRLLGGR